MQFGFEPKNSDQVTVSLDRESYVDTIRLKNNLWGKCQQKPFHQTIDQNDISNIILKMSNYTQTFWLVGNSQFVGWQMGKKLTFWGKWCCEIIMLDHHNNNSISDSKCHSTNVSVWHIKIYLISRTICMLKLQNGKIKLPKLPWPWHLLLQYHCFWQFFWFFTAPLNH